VCVERRMHGSVGGVGPSSREAVRAYPTETRFSGSWSAASKARPRPSRGRAGQLTQRPAREGGNPSPQNATAACWGRGGDTEARGVPENPRQTQGRPARSCGEPIQDSGWIGGLGSPKFAYTYRTEANARPVTAGSRSSCHPTTGTRDDGTICSPLKRGN